MKERDIQKLIMDYFNAMPGTRLYRRNVAGPQRMKGGAYVRLGKKGMADLWGVSKGRHIEIEVKREGEKPTKDQEHWLIEQLMLGAVAFFADSLEEAIQQYHKQMERPVV